MKRKLLCIVLVLSLLFVCAGCSSNSEVVVQDTLEGRFTVVEDIGPCICIVRDVKTNVLYYATITYNHYYSLCPYYDENGQIGKYEEGERI